LRWPGACGQIKPIFMECFSPIFELAAEVNSFRCV
jgi:hypothetical protein